MYNKPLSVRVMVGLFLILVSYVIGWPAIGALGVISVSMGKPLLLVVGGPLVYGLSHLVFLIGMYLAGKDYAAACWKWVMNSLTPINGISKLTKLFFARKAQKIISYLLRKTK